MAARRRTPPRCPICKGEVAAEAASRPFCSDRCKMVDLGRWLQGEYVIPGEDAVSLDPSEMARLDDAGASGGSSEPDA